MTDKSRRVKIIEATEPWTVVKLEDGSIIHMKIVVTGVHIVLNEDESVKYNPDGSPLYGINSQNVLWIDTYETVPEGTKRN